MGIQVSTGSIQRSRAYSLIPQRIYTGYVFPSADSIKPFLEDPITGPTSRFCAELATHLKCHVVAGYPERLPDDEVEPGVDEWGNAITRVGANSAIIFGPDGGCVGKYRKTNLWETDTTWAKPGKKLLILAFEGMHLISWIGRHRVHDVPLTTTTKLRQPRDLHGH